MQPAVKDVDRDAPWLAWCGHPANASYTWSRSYFRLTKVAQKLENAVLPVLEWVCSRLRLRTSSPMNWGWLRLTRLDCQELSAN